MTMSECVQHYTNYRQVFSGELFLLFLLQYTRMLTFMSLKFAASRAFQFHLHMVCCFAPHIVASSINHKLHCEGFFDFEGRILLVISK